MTSEFEAQIAPCLPDLWRYAFSLTRSRDQADDLVQDCAERALRKQALWAATGPLKPWLMKMLLNIWRNELQKKGRRGEMTPIDDLTREPAAADALGHRLALGETARALDTLPEDQREALLIVVLGGMSYKEAAQALDLPMGTLMSRLGRARAGLRAALAPRAEEEGV